MAKDLRDYQRFPSLSVIQRTGQPWITRHICFIASFQRFWHEPFHPNLRNLSHWLSQDFFKSFKKPEHHENFWALLSKTSCGIFWYSNNTPGPFLKNIQLKSFIVFPPYIFFKKKSTVSSGFGTDSQGCEKLTRWFLATCLDWKLAENSHIKKM